MMGESEGTCHDPSDMVSWDCFLEHAPLIKPCTRVEQ